jgi:hypothetical protein
MENSKIPIKNSYETKKIIKVSLAFDPTNNNQIQLKMENF